MIRDYKVHELIHDFDVKFEEACKARKRLMDYLEDEYEIDYEKNALYLEDKNSWCYGVNTDHIENLTNDSKEKDIKTQC